MKNSVALWVLVLCFGCDTTSNIEPPDESFFLKFYGGEGNQEGVDAVVNSDGTITLFGTTEGVSTSQNKISKPYLVNIQSNGLINWEVTLDANKNTRAKDIELTSDGRLAIVADIENTPTERDILVVSLSLTGSLIASDTIKFFQTIGGAPTDETGNSITQTSDGFIVAGSTSRLDLKPNAVAGDTRDALHVRLFDDLSEYSDTWRQAHGPGDFDEGVKVVQVSANQFYFFGSSNIDGDRDFYVLGLGPTGETNNQNDFLPGIKGSDENLTSVIVSPAQSGEGFLLAGISTASGSGSDIFIVKLRKDLNFAATTDEQFEKTLAIQLGTVSNPKISAYPSANSGFFILANERSGSVQNFYLTKIDNNGFLAWTDKVIFGGEKDDKIGSVLELPDGSIGIVGTFGIGEDGETKMTFIRVNQEGKFLK